MTMSYGCVHESNLRSLFRFSPAVALSALPGMVAAQTLPSGFVDEAVVNVGAPTALAFTPDGRMLITTQGGPCGGQEWRTARHRRDHLQPAATGADPRICSGSERGLLGVAVDPVRQQRLLYPILHGSQWFVVRHQRHHWNGNATL